jgi:putative acetyltransferase
MYELSPPDQVFAFDVGKLKAPEVSFWTAWRGELLLGCATLKELSSSQGEIKSMRTPSAWRRMGVGRALVDHIIDVARSRGYQSLYLETGRHPAFIPAQTLYERAGFRRCGPFGAYRENGNSVFMSLSLAGRAMTISSLRFPRLAGVTRIQRSVDGMRLNDLAVLLNKAPNLRVRQQREDRL